MAVVNENGGGVVFDGAESEDQIKKIKDNHFYNSRREEFSSENYKLEIGGLPKYYSLGHLKKLLNIVLQLDAHKVKPGGFGRNVAYVNFKNEESRERARLILDGYSWQNSNFTAIFASPAKDPVLLRKIDHLKVKTKEFIESPLVDRITKAVTPYHNMPYEDQIKEKGKVVMNLMKRFGNEIALKNPQLHEFVKWQRQHRQGQICEMDNFVRSPIREGYRNKCEFSIGHECGKTDPVVGFRVASYKEGSVEVGPIAHLKHINDQMKTVVTSMESFIINSKHDVFEPFTHTGVWRQLTVRTSNNGDLMMVVVIHPQDMNNEAIDKIKEDIVNYFTGKGQGVVSRVTSIYLQRYGQHESGRDVEYEHLWGKTYIEETILGKTFRASPDAFLQINTAACESLYSKVFEIAEVDSTTVVLDICCGVGTIGLSSAEIAHKVYGVELTEAAAENARHNAIANGITNCVVFHGRAEDFIDNMIQRSQGSKTVAIVDPPRAGLQSSVMNALRKCEYLDKLVYISCDPQAAMTNFLSLCRPRSKTYKGTFFVPLRAIPVDLFPDTPHFELVIVFERYDECKWNRIIAGNPRPKDQEYFDRVSPPPPRCDPEEETKKRQRDLDESNINSDICENQNSPDHLNGPPESLGSCSGREEPSTDLGADLGIEGGGLSAIITQQGPSQEQMPPGGLGRDDISFHRTPDEIPPKRQRTFCDDNTS